MPEIDPGTPLDRPGAPRTSICTKRSTPVRGHFGSSTRPVPCSAGDGLGTSRSRCFFSFLCFAPGCAWTSVPPQVPASGRYCQLRQVSLPIARKCSAQANSRASEVRTPGSFKRTPGSFKRTPGFFKRTPGSFKRTPGSFYRTPGSF